MEMNANHLDKILGQIGEDLFPSLGKISGYEVCRRERLMFSETCRVELYFKQCKKAIFLKKYHYENRSNDDPKPSVEKEYNILRYLRHKLSPWEGLSVIDPITYLSDEDILVTEEFVGDKLSCFIVGLLRWKPSQEKKRQIQGYFRQCGRWLRHFQEFTKRNEVKPFSKEIYIENINKKLDNCVKYGLKNKSFTKIHRFIDSKFERIGNRQQLDLGGYHGDFTPWNVLASHEEIRVLDFDRFSYGVGYDDLTLFLTALEGYKSIVGMTDRNIDLLKDNFLRGYDTENLDHDIIDLHLLKNTLKSLSMIDIHKNANTTLFDIYYEKYRKKKQVKLYLSSLDDLTNRF